MKNAEAVIIIIVIESIESLIIDFRKWLGWPAFPCLGNCNKSNANTLQPHLNHNFWQSKTIVNNKNKVSVFGLFSFFHSWQALCHIHNNIKEFFLFHPSAWQKGVDKASDRVGGTQNLKPFLIGFCLMMCVWLC